MGITGAANHTVLYVITLAALAACGYATEPIDGGLAGDFRAVTINGSTLPAKLNDASMYLADTISLGRDGAYREVITFDYGKRGYSGTFVANERSVIIQYGMERGFSLDVSDRNTLVENDEHGIIVYVRVHQ